MAASNQLYPVTPREPTATANPSAAFERQKSLVLRAWIFSGLFFMVMPGTLLGFSNLLAISSHHGLGPLPAAWLQGHGHAQVFGWIGSFVLGIGFYSQPARGRASIRISLATLALWVTGVALRWGANIYGWHWRALLPLSAGLELIALALFLRAAAHHKMPATARDEKRARTMEPWMMMVLMGTAGLAALVLFNFVECVRLALHGMQPAFPCALDQQYLLLLAWGFLVPTVWGFSARWFSAMLSIPRPDARKLRLASALDVSAILLGVSGFTRTAMVLLALGAAVVVSALHLAERPKGPAKVQGIHPSFPYFLRIAYAWLMIAGAMGIWAAYGDHRGGIWGGSRHALTVGFAAMTVFAIGPRILPHFAGARALFSKRLMFFSLLILQTGCTLRVLCEPLAYEGIARFAWKVLPLSGVLELSAVLLFALNLSLTLLLRPADWMRQPEQQAALVNISSHSPGRC